MATDSLPHAAELEPGATLQTIAAGSDLLSGLLALGRVIYSLPEVGRCSHLVLAGGAELGATFVWWSAVFASSIYFLPHRGGVELSPANHLLVRSSGGDCGVHFLH